MSEVPKPPVMDDHKTEVQASKGVVGGTVAACVFTVMGFFGFLVLSSDAWKIATFYSALGLLSAALTLHQCPSGTRRVVLWCVAGIAATFFAAAIMMRFDLL